MARTIRHRCSGAVAPTSIYNLAPARGCARSGTVARDGKHYCHQHDPEVVQKRAVEAVYTDRWTYNKDRALTCPIDGHVFTISANPSAHSDARYIIHCDGVRISDGERTTRIAKHVCLEHARTLALKKAREEKS